MTKLQKLRRSLRAISPVVAVLLMIAIAVVASLVAYAWIMGYIGFQTGKTGQAIQITSYAPGEEDNLMTIYVQNVGQGTAEVNSVFINDESVPIDEPDDLTIAKGATITLVVNLGTDTWTPGEQVKIKVITEDGTFSEKQGTGSGGPSGSPAPTWTVTSSVSGTGGSISPLGARTVTQGNSITFTINPATGYDVDDVLVDGSTVGAVASYQFTNVQDDHTIVASFEEEPPTMYTLYVNTGGTGSGNVNPSGGSYAAGTVVSVSATAAGSSDFAGFSGALSGTTTPQDLTMNSDKTVTATFNLKQYTLTVNIVGSGSVSKSPDQTTYAHGTVVTLDPQATGGYEFQGWSGDLGGSDDPETITMDGNKAVTATFGLAPVAITITSSPAGAGYVTVDGTPITTPQIFNWVPGSSHPIVANSPVSGGTGTQYVYTDWSDGGAQTHMYTVPSSPATVTANYKTQYQVSFAVSPGGAGSTTPSTPTWYDAGVGGQSISANANSGYTFSSWSANPPSSITFANPSSASTTITVNSAGTVTANFVQPITMTLLSDSFEGNWADTPWDRETDQDHSGSYSMKSEDDDNGDLISDNINAQGATSITIDFWYRLDDTGSDDLVLYYYDGSNWDFIANLGGGSQDTWLHYNPSAITDSQYFKSNFRIRFSGDSDGSGENMWVDDVTVTVAGTGMTFTDGFESSEPAWNTQWDNNPPIDFDESSTERTGSHSAHSDDDHDGYLTCDNLDTSDAISISIDFWYQLDDTETEDLILLYYNGATYVEITRLGGNTEDTWIHYQQTITDSQYFKTNFRIRFCTEGSGAPGLASDENVRIDDVLITAQVIPP